MTPDEQLAIETINNIAERRSSPIEMSSNTANVIQPPTAVATPTVAHRIARKGKRIALKFVRACTRRIFSYIVSRLAVFAEQHPTWTSLKVQLGVLDVTMIDLQQQIEDLGVQVKELQVRCIAIGSDGPPSA